MRPIGYTYPHVSARGGLSHHPCGMSGALRIYWIGSSSLVSAPFWLPVETTAFHQTWLKVPVTRSATASLNSPNFPLPVTE
ncbi:MAG TPA: hypothetical protein V6D12_24090 [Candidatus Obscuribacterales bacterium]